MEIVVLDGQTLNPGDLSWESVSELGRLTLYDQTKSNQIIERAKHAEILIVNKVRLNAETIAQLPQLKYIAISATGYNNVDIRFSNEHKIPVSNVSNYGSTNVAQHVFALILALTNRVESHYQAILKDEWQVRNAFSFWNAPIIELAEKTIGIIGYGNIGRNVAKIANGFNMKVLIYSSSAKQSDYGKFASLEEIKEKSDFISLNTHLSEANYKFVDESFLSKMKASAYLINTSRGDLINETELSNALKNNIIAGAGLDVLSTEPPELNHPLLNLSNCIITPHNAWASVEARQRLMDILVENIKSFINGQPKNLIQE